MTVASVGSDVVAGINNLNYVGASVVVAAAPSVVNVSYPVMLITLVGIPIVADVVKGWF